VARYELRGRSALVTGGARGIGLATARALAARGASVAVLDLDQAAADDAARQVRADAFGIGADVTDRGALQRAVAQVVERFGGLDVVVANAGIASRVATARAMTSENFERVLDVNLLGAWRTVDAALPEVARRGGHVVLIGSIYSFMNGAGAAPYAMSKAAVEQLGRALRVELAPHGASATVAYFGFIDTELVHRAIDADPLVDEMLASLWRPLHKRLPPQAAGEAIVRAVERRRARVFAPRRWAALSALRGVLGPAMDAQMLRDRAIADVVRRADDRAGEEQPTTA